MQRRIDEWMVNYTKEELVLKYEEKLDDLVFSSIMTRVPLLFAGKKRRDEVINQHETSLHILTDGLTALKSGRVAFAMFLEEQAESMDDVLFQKLFDVKRNTVKEM